MSKTEQTIDTVSVDIGALIEELSFILDGGMALIHTRDIVSRAAQALQSLRDDLDEVVKLFSSKHRHTINTIDGYQCFVCIREDEVKAFLKRIGRE